jgi:hypothetical protein
MAENEYRGKFEKPKVDPLKPYYPIIGLVLLIIAGAVGFFARQPAYAFIQKTFLAGQGGLPDREIMEYVVAFGIGLVIVGIASLVFAMFAPKSKNRKLTSETALKSEKDQMNEERIRAKRRKLQMEMKMKKANRQKGQ